MFIAFEHMTLLRGVPQPYPPSQSELKQSAGALSLSFVTAKNGTGVGSTEGAARPAPRPRTAPAFWVVAFAVILMAQVATSHEPVASRGPAQAIDGHDDGRAG